MATRAPVGEISAFERIALAVEDLLGEVKKVPFSVYGPLRSFRRGFKANIRERTIQLPEDHRFGHAVHISEASAERRSPFFLGSLESSRIIACIFSYRQDLLDGSGGAVIYNCDPSEERVRIMPGILSPQEFITHMQFASIVEEIGRAASRENTLIE